MKLKTQTRYIQTDAGRMKLLILRPKTQSKPLPGILWIHGGGYALGFAQMVHASAGKLLARRYGAVVLSPAYRLSGKAPYPAAFEDCCAALSYMAENAEELGIDCDRIIVGGESAGGGLAAAVCLYVRDQGKIRVRMQLPLYPMLDCRDTESSRDNHGRVWNTRRNHWGWRKYLGALYDAKAIPAYASPAHAADYRGLPPCYTFVSSGEPFYAETLAYVRKLNEAGVMAEADIYPGNIHAFDLLLPWLKRSREAREKLCGAYLRLLDEK